MEGGRVSYTSQNLWKGQDAGELTVDVSLCFIPQEAFFHLQGSERRQTSQSGFVQQWFCLNKRELMSFQNQSISSTLFMDGHAMATKYTKLIIATVYKALRIVYTMVQTQGFQPGIPECTPGGSQKGQQVDFAYILNILMKMF